MVGLVLQLICKSRLGITNRNENLILLKGIVSEGDLFPVRIETPFQRIIGGCLRAQAPINI
jgi:hypothetical protein